ncbi:uncharacterized protein LOC143909254 [Arctopsyche grandis]|uniref:uncharacterized protein LOC143909254 n=1 Tax=Arctopsyche grandis TaxID=121162 RepID=UPI00406D819A
MTGPTVQPELFSILLNFWCHQYALIADIEKMYRQIMINEEHRDLQRILWRTESSSPIRHFRLNTVTYGTSSAPFLATRQVAEDSHNKFPQISKIIVLIKYKCIMQNIWEKGVAWDGDIPNELFDEFLLHISNIQMLNHINIDRWVLVSKPIDVQMHVFCDASEKAYGAYSMVTLHWILGQPNRWTTFVANRVAEIQKITVPSQCKHISSVDNPADVVSRGISPELLIDNHIWWHGPT